MLKRSIVLLCLFLFAHAGISIGQPHWKKVLTLSGTTGASAFFFNASEGFIGTGNYLTGGSASILYTSDGGKSWKKCTLSNPFVQGQVTDIHFLDHTTGWATIHEVPE